MGPSFRVTDTAGAARLVREMNDPSQAALCPLPAARVHGLEVLHTDCGDSSRTWTRFLLLEHGTAVPGPNDDRSILIFSLKDIPGALVETLACLCKAGIESCGHPFTSGTGSSRSVSIPGRASCRGRRSEKSDGAEGSA